MKNPTVLSADIAKSVFQIALFSASKQVSKNKSIRRDKFIALIESSDYDILVMESCSGAHYFADLAKASGHDVVLIPPKTVAPYRQGQKTDANDVYAIFEAWRSVNLKPAVHRDKFIRELQTLSRLRDSVQRRKADLSRSLRGHCESFGIIILKSERCFKARMPEVLEDAENGLPESVRKALYARWQEWLRLDADLVVLLAQLQDCQKHDPRLRAPQALEGVGVVCSIKLVCALGDGRAFSSAKQASAFVGTAPKQHSSGGKEVIVGLPKVGINKSLRANLVTGAFSVIQQVKRRGPRSETEQWLAKKVTEKGEKQAAIALANKNVRRTWAILRDLSEAA